MRFFRGHAKEPRKPRPRRTGDIVIRVAERDNDEPFVFERDVSRAYVERQMEKFDPRSASMGQTLLHAYMAYPDMKEQLPISNEAKQHIILQLQDTLKYFKNDTTVCSAAEEAMALHVLFPDSRGEERELKEELRKWFVSSMKRFRSENQWFAWCNLAMTLVVIYPETKDELDIDDEAFTGIKQYLEEKHNEESVFIPMLGIVKFLFPEKAKEIPVESKDWDAFNVHMQRHRVAPGTYIHCACEAAMALADRYEILPEGSIRITSRPQKMSTSRVVPERSYL